MCERSKNLPGQRNDPIKVNLHHHHKIFHFVYQNFWKLSKHTVLRKRSQKCAKDLKNLPGQSIYTTTIRKFPRVAAVVLENKFSFK